MARKPAGTTRTVTARRDPFTKSHGRTDGHAAGRTRAATSDRRRRADDPPGAHETRLDRHRQHPRRRPPGPRPTRATITTRRTSDGRIDTDGTDADRTRTGRLLPGPADRPEGDHRYLLDRARARAGRHPLLPVRQRGGRPRRRAATCPAAMAYKNALAGLDLGGGKAVIWGDPDQIKTEALLRAYGRFVESLNGRYYTACDVGTYVAGHGRRRPRDPLRDRPQRRARRRRRLLDPHRLGRLPGHAGRRRARLGQPDAGRPPGRHRRARQGRQVPRRPPARRRRRRWSPPTSTRAALAWARSHAPAGRPGRRHRGADHRPTSTCTRRARWAAR